jgi:hypothetical protein
MMEDNSASSTRVKASKYTGVFRAGKKWKSQAQSQGVQHYLGIFATEEEAHEAYLRYKANQETYENDRELRAKLKVKGKVLNTSSAVPPLSASTSTSTFRGPAHRAAATQLTDILRMEQDLALSSNVITPHPLQSSDSRERMKPLYPHLSKNSAQFDSEASRVSTSTAPVFGSLPRISDLLQTPLCKVSMPSNPSRNKGECIPPGTRGSQDGEQSVTIELPPERMHELRLKLSLGGFLAAANASLWERRTDWGTLGYSSLSAPTPSIWGDSSPGDSADNKIQREQTQLQFLMWDILESMRTAAGPK